MRALQADALIQANESLLLKVWATPRSDTSALGPGADQSQHLSPFSDHYSLVGLMNTSKSGFQSQMFWGLISQVKFLKVGVHDFRVLLFAPQGEAVFLISFYLCFTVPGAGLKERLCPSLLYQFAVGLLSFSLPQDHSASLRVFRGCFSTCICRFSVFCRGRILLWHHLGLEPFISVLTCISHLLLVTLNTFSMFIIFALSEKCYFSILKSFLYRYPPHSKSPCYATSLLQKTFITTCFY